MFPIWYTSRAHKIILYLRYIYPLYASLKIDYLHQGLSGLLFFIVWLQGRNNYCFCSSFASVLSNIWVVKNPLSWNILLLHSSIWTINRWNQNDIFFYFFVLGIWNLEHFYQWFYFGGNRNKNCSKFWYVSVFNWMTIFYYRN